jgi:hypothetical protein
VGVDIGTHLDLLDLDGPLFLACLGGLLLGLILESTDIEDLADRRLGVGGNLDEVESGVGCDLQRLLDGDDAAIVTLVIDQLDFADANLLVYPRTFLGRGGGSIGSANGNVSCCWDRASSENITGFVQDSGKRRAKSTVPG